MIRKSIATMAVLALALCAAPAEAGGRPKPKPSTTTTRTIVNATNRSLFARVYSGTGVAPTTVGQAQAAKSGKLIAPGGKAVFNVLPNAGGNQFGDNVLVIAVPPLVMNGNSSINPQEVPGLAQGDSENYDYPGLKPGQNLTITITSGIVDSLPVLLFAPLPPN